MEQASFSAAATEIQLRNKQSIHEHMEQLANSSDLRQLIDDISLQRFNMPSIGYEPGDFDGMRKAMGAFDARTRKDGTYGERQDADKLLFDEDTDKRIYDIASEFGLTGDSKPQQPEAVAALVLGAAGKAPLDRSSYTKDLLDNGELITNRVIFLASDRPLADGESERAGSYSAGASSEFELTINAANEVFGAEFSEEDIIDGTDSNVPVGFPNHFRIAHARDENGRDLFVIASPLVTDPFDERNGMIIRRPRANTRDTYSMLNKVAGFEPGDHVVGITNAHFVPFQGADAKGQLGSLGIDAEIVGFDPSHFGNKQKTSQELLQEMLTAADSLAKAA